MRFNDLYKIVVDQNPNPPIHFDDLRHLINKHHAGVGKIDVYPISYPTSNLEAHYKMTGVDRSSAYEEEYELAQIRYCDGLDDHPRQRRFALTKELMHVFDTGDERVDSREKFDALLREIQNQPVNGQQSAALNSENTTRWMAVIILCPKPMRDAHRARYEAGTLEPYEIAETFRIPEAVVPAIMDSYYDTAFKYVMDK